MSCVSLEIDIGDGESGVLLIKQEDDAQILAEQFAEDHNLGREVITPLTQYVLVQQRRLPEITTIEAEERPNSLVRRYNQHYMQTRSPSRTTEASPIPQKRSSSISKRLNSLYMSGMLKRRSMSQQQDSSETDIRSEASHFHNSPRTTISTRGNAPLGSRLYDDAMRLQRVRSKEISDYNIHKSQLEEQEISKRWRNPEENEEPCKLFSPCITTMGKNVLKKAPVHFIAKHRAPIDFRAEAEQAECTFKPHVPSAHRSGKPLHKAVFDSLYADADVRAGRQKYAEELELYRMRNSSIKRKVKPHVVLDRSRDVDIHNRLYSDARIPSTCEMLTSEELGTVKKHSRKVLCVGLYGGAQIKDDGTVITWGEGLSVSVKEEVISLSGSFEHFVLLLKNGRVVEFGNVSEKTPNFRNAVTAVAAGCGFTAAIVNDRVKCWGANKAATTVPNLKHSSVAISCGYSHTATILEDGSIVVWGSDTDVFGNPHCSPITSPPITSKKAIAISSGAFHCVALLDDNSIIAWGSNTKNQCLIPTLTTTNVIINDLSCGFTSSGILLSDGRIICWGRGSPPTPDGIPDIGPHFVPPASGSAPREGFITSISLGNNNSAALTNTNHLLLWGNDFNGRAHQSSQFITE